ncbi:MAG: hypothetical protein SH820_11730 [Xanthomonadales bacterium]|nr:hypothetical protein [Xanthomonadales bacterium]
MNTSHAAAGFYTAYLAEFTDARQIQGKLKAAGVELLNEADENSSGPVSFTAIDPDGNTLLLDQHV